MSKQDDDMNRVNAACEALGEHFDTVQIFVTRHDAYERDGTVSIALGRGDWFSRYGKVQEWMIRQDERTRKDVREEA